MLKRNYADYVYFLDEESAGEREEELSLKSRKLWGRENSSLIIPKVQKGLVVSAFEKELTVSSNMPVTQELKEHEILVRNKYIGLNHVDWKSKKYQFNIYSFPWINGRESSGIVVKRGSNVDQEKFPLAAEVFLASTSYRDLRTSTFQEYTVFDSRLVWRIPQQNLLDGSVRKSFGLEFAGGIGVGLVTAGCAISSLVSLATENQTNGTKLGNIIIWGGSSSVGVYAIQLAKASGKFKKIIAVSSTKHKKYLSEIGASCVIDRYLPEMEIRQKIQDHCPEGVNYGMDVISKETALFLSKLLGQSDASVKRLVCTCGLPEISTDTFDKDAGSKLIIEAVNIKQFHENIEFGSWLVEYTTKLFETGHLRPIKTLKIFKSLNDFGESIVSGLKELEEKGASAEKFIVSL
ncbi:hypothetical protein HG536_0A09620 [Torulaspora globosa]|uniref:Uncharacterized protein n=1 Tax=Torulaspora globosa TaxID=48254 RepID=A0A7G3ZCA9_9SACH|nr:uncharacterized protein HG536_0A09620 [Torulaspora globosa]QLL31145.1 hypothetical protein HG536_0A09620 [Torulaspora globosa]